MTSAVLIDLSREFRFVTIENRMERSRRELFGDDSIMAEAAVLAIDMARLIRCMDDHLKAQLPSDCNFPESAA